MKSDIAIVFLIVFAFVSMAAAVFLLLDAGRFIRNAYVAVYAVHEYDNNEEDEETKIGAVVVADEYISDEPIRLYADWSGPQTWWTDSPGWEVNTGLVESDQTIHIESESFGRSKRFIHFVIRSCPHSYRIINIVFGNRPESFHESQRKSSKT